MKRYFKFLPAALLAAMLGTTAHAGGVSDKEIVLGTHMDLSGPVAAGMPHLRNGMQMRLDEVNEAGGINGRKIKLEIEDQGDNNLQVEFAVGCVGDKFAPLVFNPSSERLLVGAGREVNAALVNQERCES
jgi:ABC-type branched-subunit amino acid transport system substrate-binding protein